MYTARSYDEILSELKDEYKGAESLVEGSFSMDVFQSNGVEFFKTELELAEAYRQSFGDTADGEYLAMRAAEHGVIRRAATKSKGTVTVQGKGTVNEGALFATTAGTRFVATQTVQVDGTAEIEIEAQLAGSSGNVAAGTIVKIPLNIAGIHSVINSAATVDGYDEESDEELRERFLLKVRKPGTTGNPADYIHHCLEIEGVGAVSVLRNPAGRCTVGLYIVDSDMQPANDELLERVSESIADWRPVGAQVYVNSAEPVTIDIAVDIVGTLDADTFKTSVVKYFQSLLLAYEPNYTTVDHYEDALTAVAGTVTRGKIGELLMKAGASDYNYDSMRLNGEFKDVKLTVSQMPLLGSVTLRQTIKV